MFKPHEFLSPACTARTLDIFQDRRAILRSLQRALPLLHGTLLDIGCGYMPYRQLVLAPPSEVRDYLGMDTAGNEYQKPDITWDGRHIPLPSLSVDCAMATEILEHCPEPEWVLRETLRVLRPGGLLFLTVPFLWPLHSIPDDQYRFTPFALERHLRGAGFINVELHAHGGWDASLAQMIGLWVRRRPMRRRTRAVLSLIAKPLVRFLSWRDRAPADWSRNSMITGLAGTAIKPAA
jgi:SAM-dependent methyltransferase